MITIFSIDSDQSTNHVIDWLTYYKTDWERINAEDFENSLPTLCLPEKNCKNNKKQVVWFRKWDKAVNSITHNTKNNYLEINKAKEFDEYSKFLFQNYNKSFWLNHPKNWDIDKLTQLKEANKIGLKTPATLFTSEKKHLVEFLKKHKKIITKNLSANLCVVKKEEVYMSYTTQISDEDIANMEESFFPSLFQEEIEKEFEIRTFYLDSEFYSMAIFSQNDKQTTTDFRHYNINKPNRCIPFILPNSIESKLKKLMNNIKINSGSIDLIKNKFGEYIFLEVNPLGQFGMTSFPCNYYLEKKIAKYLKQKENE